MNRYKERALQEHLAHDQALISFIQSLAFGFLLTTLVKAFASGPNQFQLLSLTTYATYRTWFLFLEALLTMQFIVLVWQEYWYGTIFLRWTLRIADYWIPFMFGLTEFFLIKLLGGPISIFYLMTTFFATVAWWGLHNQLSQSSRPEFSEENGCVLKELQDHHKSLMKWAISYPFIWLSLALLTHLWPLKWVVLLTLLLSNLLALGHSVVRQKEFNRILEKEEFPPSEC